MTQHSALSTRHYRIAIDYTPAYEQGGGIGRYVRELVAALARQPIQFDYRLFVSGAGDLPPLPGASFTWKPTPITPRWLARVWGRARLPLPVELFTGRVDLYHATDFVLPPTNARATLLTVHDLSFVRVPEAASPSLKAYLDAVVPRSVRRADHILADSQATKADLVAVYGTPPEKITVLLSGVDARFKPTDDPAVRDRYNIPDRPFVFSVGTVQPRKNYARLIQALAQLRQQGYDLDLVIAGGKGWLEDSTYDAIHEAKMDDHVHVIGFANDADLPALYSTATITAVPSLYEGFGIPVLESMACATPVVTSNISSLPEVAGDAALTVTPTDTDAIADALRRIIDDSALRDTLITRGLERAAAFTWDRSAEQLVGIYARMLS